MVRRSIAVASMCIGFAGAASAQTVTGGVKAGGIVTTVNSPAVDGTNAGVTLGGFVTVPVSTHWSLQPELLFVQQRERVATIGGGATTRERDDLEIPVSLRRQFGGGAVRPYLLISPSLVIRLRTKAQELSSPDTFSSGLAIGGGIERGRWLVEGSLKRFAIGSSLTGVTTRAGISILAGRRF